MSHVACAAAIRICRGQDDDLYRPRLAGHPAAGRLAEQTLRGRSRLLPRVRKTSGHGTVRTLTG
jgi:hypothetical protein